MFYLEKNNVFIIICFLLANSKEIKKQFKYRHLDNFYFIFLLTDKVEYSQEYTGDLQNEVRHSNKMLNDLLSNKNKPVNKFASEIIKNEIKPLNKLSDHKQPKIKQKFKVSKQTKFGDSLKNKVSNTVVFKRYIINAGLIEIEVKLFNLEFCWLHKSAWLFQKAHDKLVYFTHQRKNKCRKK